LECRGIHIVAAKTRLRSEILKSTSEILIRGITKRTPTQHAFLHKKSVHTLMNDTINKTKINIRNPAND
jgi:hypothetical protein